MVVSHITGPEVLQRRWCVEERRGHPLPSVSRAAVLMRMIMLRRRPVLARDFFSTILDTTTATATAQKMTQSTSTTETANGLSSSSPLDGQVKKRTRSALKELSLHDGSPEKKDISRPPRKASRASVSSSKSDKENDPEDQENMMLDL